MAGIPQPAPPLPLIETVRAVGRAVARVVSRVTRIPAIRRPGAYYRHGYA